jgi:hypothetical protein
MSGQLHATARLPPGMKAPLPINSRLGGSRSRTEYCEKNDISCSCRESKPGRPTCSPGIWTLRSGQRGKTRVIDLEAVKCGDLNWINLTLEGAVVTACEHCTEPSAFVRNGEIFLLIRRPLASPWSQKRSSDDCDYKCVGSVATASVV